MNITPDTITPDNITRPRLNAAQIESFRPDAMTPTAIGAGDQARQFKALENGKRPRWIGCGHRQQDFRRYSRKMLTLRNAKPERP